MKLHKNKVGEFIKHPKKALFKLSIPIVVAMLVQSLYNIVDTAFVGRLGAESIAALTFAFPVFFVLIALNSGISVGMSSRISRYLGSKNKTAAENTALHGIFLSLAVGLVMLVLGIIFLRPMLSMFGAEPSVIELSTQYLTIILVGIVFMFPSFVLSGIFSAQGDTKTPMRVQVTALCINAVLDPIFIYVLGLGVRGAAIATVLAFVISLFLFIYYIRIRSYLKISLNCFRFSKSITKDIFRVGAPASFMMLLMSAYAVIVNRFMAGFGTDYVAAFGISFRLDSLAFMPIAGFSMGLVTLVGMFYGAKRYDLLKDIIWYSAKIGIIFTSFMGVVFFVFPSVFLRIFTPDANLISLGVPFIRITVFALPLSAVSMMISRAMQGMGKGVPGLVINLVRSIIVAIPLAYVLIYVLGYGYLSIAFSVVMGAVCSTFLASVWLGIYLRKLNGTS